MTYPLSVVTTVTAINRSGLRAGMLPIYANWQDAYNQLSQTVSDSLCLIGEIVNCEILGTIKTRFEFI